MTKVLAIYAEHNKPGLNKATGKPWRDASHVFEPEAHAFTALHGGVCFPFDNRQSPPKRRAQVESILKDNAGGGYDGVAFFCHGLKESIQTGHSVWGLHRLVLALTKVVVARPFVTLYACDAADSKTTVACGGDGGFADKLRDALVKHDLGKWIGGHVDAHSTTGHATRNPDVRRFDCSPAVPSEVDLGIVGGQWIVEPGSDLWKPWVRALRTDFRLTFPTLSTHNIRTFLQETA